MGQSPTSPPQADSSAFASEPAAPRSWRNWCAKREGAPLLGAVELRLFSDAWFIGDALGHGPYKLLNPVPHTTRGGRFEWKPAIVLRAEHFLPTEIGNMQVTDDDHYHGGWIYDEVAALVALLLGARIIAGPVDREFGYEPDPLGRPRAYSSALLPTLPVQVDAPQIPALFGQRDLREINLLDSFPDLERQAAIALVKGARLYQQALWVSDTTPETAWLLLVSAIETAAGYWNAAELTPAERLTLSYPRLVRLLLENPDNTLVDKVAAELHRLIAANGKFIGFCTTFAPDPPEQRPKLCRFDFAAASYKDAIKKIYRYRSRALHGGTPFPNPMCRPPMTDHDGTGIPEERPSGLGAGALGSTWVADDLPMLLHLFAYITRGVLLNWWRSLAAAPVDSLS